MASSGHFSPVTSVEAVPSAAADELRSEVPLLASQEGTERTGRGWDGAALLSVPRLTFGTGFVFHCCSVCLPRVIGTVLSAGLPG